MVADELRRQADSFVDLVELKNDIERALPADHPRSRIHREDIARDDDDDDDYEDDYEEFYEAESA